MPAQRNSSSKRIYIILLAVMLIAALDIWFVANAIQARNIGYLYWESLLTIIILLASILVSWSYQKDIDTKKGMLTVFGFLIFEIILVINYAGMVSQIDKLSFYFHLSITASVFLLVSMLGNISKVEKNEEDGFNIMIYSKDSPIPKSMLIPLWIGIFLFMGLFVGVSGSVLVAYPQFGLMELLGGPVISGFAVGDWENIVMLVLFFEIARGALRYIGVGKRPAIIAALLVGMTSFTVYHSLVYSTNMLAILIVGIFALVSLLVYNFTKSLIPISAMHGGNNFFGALFNATVFGASVFTEAGPVGNVIVSISLIIATGAVVFFVTKGVKKRGKKK